MPRDDFVHELRTVHVGDFYSMSGKLHDDQPEHLHYFICGIQYIVRYFFWL